MLVEAIKYPKLGVGFGNFTELTNNLSSPFKKAIEVGFIPIPLVTSVVLKASHSFDLPFKNLQNTQDSGDDVDSDNVINSVLDSLQRAGGGDYSMTDNSFNFSLSLQFDEKAFFSTILLNAIELSKRYLDKVLWSYQDSSVFFYNYILRKYDRDLSNKHDIVHLVFSSIPEKKTNEAVSKISTPIVKILSYKPS